MVAVPAANRNRFRLRNSNAYPSEGLQTRPENIFFWHHARRPDCCRTGAAVATRAETIVVLMTPRGYAHPALVDSIGFTAGEGQGVPIVIMSQACRPPCE